MDGLVKVSIRIRQCGECVVILCGQSRIPCGLKSQLSGRLTDLEVLSHSAHGVEPTTPELILQESGGCVFQDGESFLQGLDTRFHPPEVDVDLGDEGQQVRSIVGLRGP